MRKLYFVRHGLSKWNKAGLIAGSSDTPLTWTGKRQAKIAGKNARNFHVGCIVSSPSKRALKTARIIARQIGYPVSKIHINNLLMERDFGPMEGKPWSPDLNLDGIADVESEESVLRRAELALKWINSLDAHNILVVSHGTFGRALRSLVNPNYTMNDHGQLNNAELYLWYGED